MGTSLEVFFGKFAGYIIAVLIVVSAILGAGWYVSTVKLYGQTQRADKIAQQLEVSNSSYASIRDQFKALTKTLEQNQEQALLNQATISGQLLEAINKSKPNLALEKQLLERQPQGECKTPEDLKNAFNSL